MDPVEERCRLIAAALRQLAWVEGGSMLSETADALEIANAETVEWCCPLCEEVVCDGGCALADLRPTHLQPSPST